MKVTCPNCKRRVNIQRKESSNCKCGNTLDYRNFFKQKIDYDVYLIDANVLIYAKNNDGFLGRCCKKVMMFYSPKITIGTTARVIKEVGKSVENSIPGTIKIYKTGKISEKLMDIKTNVFKQPSEADLSLIQVAIEHPEIKGLITYDKDFDRIATSGLIESRSTRRFWLGDAKDFLDKYEVKSLVGDKI